jgi:phage-related protein
MRPNKVKTDPAAKPLQGFGGRSVLEIIADHEGDTWRAIYTIRFKETVYVSCTPSKRKQKRVSPRPRRMLTSFVAA